MTQVEQLAMVQEKGINPVTGEIYLFGHAGAANNLLTNFTWLDRAGGPQAGANIILHLSNFDLSWATAKVMYDVIRRSDKHVTAINYGDLGASSCLLFSAADTRIMLPHALFSLPNFSEVTSVVLRMYVDLLAGEEYFSARPPQEIEQWLVYNGGKSFASEEAVKYGLAENIIGVDGFKW